MSAWICYCSLHETKSLNMFSRHWKTVMFGFAPKQCTPFKTHEMESFKSHERTCPHPPPLNIAPPALVKLRLWLSNALPAQKPVSGLAPGFSFIFLFHYVVSVCDFDCDSNSGSVASKNQLLPLIFHSLPCHLLDTTSVWAFSGALLLGFGVTQYGTT